MKPLTTVILAALAVAAASCNRTSCMEDGVSWGLARERKESISGIKYSLEYHIPEKVEDPVQGSMTLTFSTTKTPVILDFRPGRDAVKSLEINGKACEPDCRNEHIILPGRYLHKGINTVSIEFTPDDASLNRHEDYLYSLLVPERARTVFPCFDQPDLKASFELVLDIPVAWTAVSNGPALEESTDGNRKRVTFAKSGLISTYLFEFTAGVWEKKTFENGMSVYYRETDPAKVAQLPEIHRQIEYSLAWMEEFTGIPMPFEKYDYVIVPGFQFGGMEHPGAILFNEGRVFLPEAPTDAEKLSRTDLLAHETAHLWFGDAVTMEWFNDVWTKEVFANHFAAMIARPLYPEIDYRLRDFRSFNVPAYDEDRTAGTVPIRQRLDNLNDAGLIYGNIIYEKAPVVMRMLAQTMGEDAFRDGLREYLGKYMYSNSTWPELIEILDGYSDADLRSWSREWVEEAGMPVYPPADGLANRDALGYGYYQLTEKGIQASIDALLSPARGGETVLTRAYERLSTLANLHENMLGGRMDPARLVSCIDSLLRWETNPLVSSTAMSYLGNTIPYIDRPEVMENLLLSLSRDEAVPQQIRLSAFRQLVHHHRSAATSAQICAIWEERRPYKGLVIPEEDYTTMAFELALRFPQTRPGIGEIQRKRISNPDKLARFDFIWPSTSASEEVRDSVFSSLLDPKNRITEPWVETSLALLCHPLRDSDKYIVPALDEMEEIQRTGDIFFPKGWISSVLGGRHSKEAADTVQSWLEENKDYPPLLRSKILQAADPLLRRYNTEYHE